MTAGNRYGEVHAAQDGDGSGLMIEIGKSDLRIVKPASRAYVRLKLIPDTPLNSDYVLLYSDWLEFGGTIDFTGSQSVDTPGTWRIGFSQLELHNTDRTYYRGAQNTDGSVTVRRDRPPARKYGASRDCQSRGDPLCFSPQTTAVWHPVYSAHSTTQPFNMIMNSSFPFTAKVAHTDPPASSYPVRQNNPLTNQACMLHSLLLECR